MADKSEQTTVETASRTAPDEVSEQELIEAAAAAAPAEKSTTTQKAMDVVAAAAIQRDAITRSFNEKKAQVTQAVEQQRAVAMQQVHAAKQSHIAHGAGTITADAHTASENLAKMAQAASAPPSATTNNRAENNQHRSEIGAEMTNTQFPKETAVQSGQQPVATGYSSPEYTAPSQTPGTILPKTVSPETAGQGVEQATPPVPPTQQQITPPQQPPIPPTQPTVPQTAVPTTGAPIAEELALTIRAIISQEIEKQLQGLLAAYTNTAPPQDPQH